MSSSSTFRPDPFSQPFFPTAELASAGKERPRSKRPLWLYTLLIGIVIGGAIYFFVPAIAATTYASAAMEAYSNRDEAKAIEQLNSGIEWQPEDFRCLELRCIYYSRQGEIKKAKADLTAIDAILSSNGVESKAGLLTARASLRQLCHQYRLALEDLKRSQALKAVDDSREKALDINNVAYSAGLAVEFEPGKPLADEQLLLAMLGDCETAVKLSGEDRSIVDTRGYLHYLLGNYTQAIVDFDKAVATSERELEQGRKQVEQNTRDAYYLRLQLREHEYSAAVMYRHRMKAHQKAGNAEAAKKDQEAIVKLGFKPELPLN